MALRSLAVSCASIIFLVLLWFVISSVMFSFTKNLFCFLQGVLSLTFNDDPTKPGKDKENMYHAKPEIEVKLLLNLFLVTTFCQRRWGEDKLHGEELERKTREKFIICANQSSCAYYSANHIIPFFSTCSVFQRSALPKPFPQLSLPWCSFL